MLVLIVVVVVGGTVTGSIVRFDLCPLENVLEQESITIHSC